VIVAEMSLIEFFYGRADFPRLDTSDFACPRCVGVDGAPDAKCRACGGTGCLPQAVLDTMIKHAARRATGTDDRPEDRATRDVEILRIASETARALRWSYDHFSFDFAGMYVGVELDGHMHS
jgi:hypothetical protein